MPASSLSIKTTKVVGIMTPPYWRREVAEFEGSVDSQYSRSSFCRAGLGRPLQNPKYQNYGMRVNHRIISFHVATETSRSFHKLHVLYASVHVESLVLLKETHGHACHGWTRETNDVVSFVESDELLHSMVTLHFSKWNALSRLKECSNVELCLLNPTCSLVLHSR
ncbi:hypothetical protein AKJ16_DCAP24490 [Drosera capensis]